MKRGRKTTLLEGLASKLTGYKKLAVAFAAIVVFSSLGMWHVPAVFAQSAAPKFEVAAIRLHAPGSGFHAQECVGDRFRSVGVPLVSVIAEVYDLRGASNTGFLQQIGAKITLDKRYYDFEAKAAGPIESESQCRLMVQSLLADRFKLAFHYETRDVELLDLVVARGGPKLQQALPADEGTDVNFVLNGFSYTHAPIADADTRARTKGVTMQELAQWLTTPAMAPQPIADKTGLAGRYKIDLRISTSLPADGRDPVDPPLEAAIGKLGLRLEKHKGSVRVPVLDHIEPPDAN
jgi:uncharacterized protein (TIGR03435 family)